MTGITLPQPVIPHRMLAVKIEATTAVRNLEIRRCMEESDECGRRYKRVRPPSLTEAREARKSLVNG
jgi:hypothetical protein